MTIENFIQRSNRMLVITGAGCSTASGIGDYRDEQGEWKRAQPVQHQAFMQTHAWRQRYWARSQVGYPEFKQATPNVAHQVLARWESQGRLCGLITQNVDGLHQRAGHQQVIDLHGRLDQVVCMACGDTVSRDAVQQWLDSHNTPAFTDTIGMAPDGDADLARTDFSTVKVPQCAQCGGILKPDVVFFGDSVPRDRVAQGFAQLDQADSVLVIGSSLMVYSSFRFVRRAAELGLPIAALNRGKTRADEMLTLKVDADCGETLKKLSTLEPVQ
ncbi:MAG: NAD-dependent protein deacetylase [Pseudomonadaceae bacterium]|nr:NAD-dependent protein deacetylase [Pseudomonadaceae bacterium]